MASWNGESQIQLVKRASHIQAIVLVLFFLSGAAGLVYEVVWQRMLVLVFGSTAFATSTILAAFMCGLALGSFYFGRLVDRYREPLKLYAYLEAGIAVFAVLVPFIISGITAVYTGIYQNLHTTFYLFSLLKFLLCFIVLVIPSFLMGGTLPILSKLFVGDFRNLGRRIGSLYGSNTLGAVVGAFSAGFFLIILLGAKETTYVAAAVNLLVAAAAFGLSRISLPAAPEAAVDVQHQEQEEERETASSGAADHRPYPRYVLNLVLVVYGLSGFCALAYEVLWTRVLVFYFHSTTYAFTIMLTTFLFGLALGSFIFGRFIDRWKHQLNLLVIIEVLIGLFAILSIWEFSRLNALMGNLVEGRQSWQIFVVARYAGAFLIMFIPTLLMGIAFPLVSKIYTQNRESLGRHVGNVYSVNTVGSVLGSIVAGFAMIPLMGITNSIILVASLNLILGIAVLLANPFMRRRVKQVALAGTAAIMVVIIVVSPVLVRPDRHLTLYSSRHADLGMGGKVLFYEEGIGATVTVHQLPADPFDGQVYKLLEVDGINVAGTHPMLHLSQKLQGHLPILLYKASTGKDPRNVFLLGMASGASSYAATRHRIDRLDCLEIVSAEKNSLPYFSEINGDILNEPKFRLIIEDARNHLLASREEYDVIESDTVHPEQNASLFTREYFALARDKVSEDGIVSVWLPMYNMSDETFKLLIKTFHSVFPHTTIWFTSNYPTRYSLMVGSKTELKIDFQVLQEELEYPPVKDSLAEVGLDDIFTVLTCFITNEDKIGEYVAGSLVNTDNRPYLAYLNPKQKGRDDLLVPTALGMLVDLSLPVFPYLVNMGEAEAEIRTTLENRSLARSHVIQAIAHDYELDFTGAIHELEEALALDPEDRNVQDSLALAESKQLAQLELAYSYLTQGAGLLQSGRLDEAMKTYRYVLQFYPKCVMAYHGLATIHYARGEYDQTIAELNEAITIDPEYAYARYSLAIVYIQAGKYEEAETELEEVLRIDPDFEEARAALENLKKTAR